MANDNTLQPPEGWVPEGQTVLVNTGEPDKNKPGAEWVPESSDPARGLRNPATEALTGATIGVASKAVNPATEKIISKVADVVSGPVPSGAKPSVFRPQPASNAVINWLRSQHITDITPGLDARHYKEAHQKMISSYEAEKKAEALKKLEDLFRTEEEIRKAATPVKDVIQGASNIMTPAGGQSLLGKAASLGTHTLGRALAGGSALYQGTDAWNRLQRGDYTGAAIGGLGALGSGVALIPTPMTRVVGTAMGLGGELGTTLLDKYRAAQEPKQPGMANGGLVYLAAGGSPDLNVSMHTPPNMSGMPGVGYMKMPQSTMLRAQLEQELADRARLRAGATGMGMAIPGQHGVKFMPGNVEAGLNVPVGQGNIDISGYRSINPVNTPVQQGGHMYGANVRYTLPFAEGGDVKKSIAGALSDVGFVKGPNLSTMARDYISNLPETTRKNIEHTNWMVQNANPIDYTRGKNPYFSYDPKAEKEFNEYIPNLMGIFRLGKGGNWLPRNLRAGSHWTPEEQAAEAVGFSKTDPALENWANTQLTRYMKNEMGSPDDSIRKLADQGVLHFKPRPSYREHNNQPTNLFYAAETKRANAGMPEGETALTSLGKDWENTVDAGTISRIIPKRTIEAYSSEYPWLKNAEGKKIHLIDEEFLYSKLGFDHMIDVLREQMAAGHLRPESLKSLSVPQAVQRVHEYNLAKQRAMEKIKLQQQGELPVHKEYPEGYKWLELKHPTNNEMTEQALKYEGDAMGHCVGGYCPEVLSNNAKIYSLRDAKGEPHVTIEVAPGKHPIGYSVSHDEDFPKTFELEDLDMNKINLPKEQYDAIYNRAKEIFSNRPNININRTDLADMRYGAFQQAANEVLGELPGKIQQIKGKQNVAPKAEYQPFVQDFVRSGDWADVRDLHNTGLKNMAHTGSNYELTNVPEDIAKLKHTERYHAVQEAIKNKDIPKYATEEEIANAIRKYGNFGGLDSFK